MKVLVTGSRDWTDYTAVHKALVAVNATTVIHGWARGADRLAMQAASDMGIPPANIRGYRAEWERYGKSAGPKRNQLMLDREHLITAPIDVCLAFPLPQSRGTWDMMRRCEAAGINVVIVGVS